MLEGKELQHCLVYGTRHNELIVRLSANLHIGEVLVGKSLTYNGRYHRHTGLHILLMPDAAPLPLVNPLSLEVIHYLGAYEMRIVIGRHA